MRKVEVTFLNTQISYTMGRNQIIEKNLQKIELTFMIVDHMIFVTHFRVVLRRIFGSCQCS